MKIMLADDEVRIHTIVQRIADDEGYDFIGAFDGNEAIKIVAEKQPDLLILDVMMPRLDGFQACKKIRSAGIHIPIIFLSAKGDIVDKGVGFEAGADDYLVKPFSAEELSMRIRAHLRRQQHVADVQKSVIEYDDLKVDLKKRRVSKRGEAIELTPKELDILAIFAAHEGEVFTREQLTVQVWGEEYAGEVLGIAVYIRRIREKIEDNPSKPHYIQTVWREGYRFGD